MSSLRERLPAELRSVPAGPEFESAPFRSICLLDNEWAAEAANRTMHGVLHLGWVAEAGRGYHGEMAVHVKPNGVLRRACMAAIRPFRHSIIYPAMLRKLERAWRAHH